MRKTFLASLLVFAAILVLVFYTTRTFADDKPNHGRSDNDDRNTGKIFNPDKELSKSSCGDKLKDPVIDVTQKVQNDADSGVAGDYWADYWAFDYYMRHITVWQTDVTNTYCAIVTYNGNFYAVPGQVGPGNNPVGIKIDTSTNEPVNGNFSGGRRATIVGTLLSPTLWTKHGSVGTTNYQCDINGNCPGLISWAGQYFSGGYTNTDVWWGWKYTAGSHGTWINAISGNSGNIL